MLARYAVNVLSVFVGTFFVTTNFFSDYLSHDPYLQPRPPTPATAAPTPSPSDKVNGASKGKFDQGNAKGGTYGKGYGVQEDPKACANKNKKQCKKDDACDWDEDDGVCSAKTGAALKESVDAVDEIPMQPNTAAIVPQAVMIMNTVAMVVVGFVAAMWYGN